MHDLPNPDQLLTAVSRFLRDDAGPALGRHGDNALAYQARVAANMVDTVARQTALGPAADAAFARGDYTASLQALAALRTPVDAFFDGVMVNADDAALRANRLALLASLASLMSWLRRSSFAVFAVYRLLAAGSECRSGNTCGRLETASEFLPPFF